MRSVYIGSSSEFSGKSLVTIGLGLKMKEQGLKVGYIKPFESLWMLLRTP